jgi:hypothetical protein
MTLFQFLVWLTWFFGQHCTLTWMSATGSPIHYEGICRQAWNIASVNHGFLQLVTP